MANQIKIDVSQMGDVKIENKDGVVIITPVEKREGGLPEVGYWVDEYSDIVEIQFVDGIFESERHRNIYPRENHAILFGQVLAPLLVKHWVLTGGYWEKKCEYAVYWCQTDRKWGVSKYTSYQLALLEFPFPNEELAEQFLEQNRSQLDEISRLWQEG